LDANHQAFIENKGQWDRRADFRAQTSGLDYWLTPKGVTFDYHRPMTVNGKSTRAGQIIKMTFAGSSGATSETGLSQKAHTAHYMTKGAGKMLNPSAFEAVTSHGVYPGIDFKSYYDNQNLRYDFIVKPHADASAIKLRFDGATKVTVKSDDLDLHTQIGTFGHGKLYAYQVTGGMKSRVTARFVENRGIVGIRVGAYDHSKPLVIDPVVYGTYYGGDNGWDAVTSVVSDSNGNVFMTGWTQATLFPVTTGPYFTSLKGSQNAFVARLQGDAYNIDYSAFFGGSRKDYGQYIAADQFNNIWIIGLTTSSDFPGNTKTHTGATEADIFLMRWQASQSLVLDPLTNPAIQMFGYDASATATTTNVQGFAIVPDPNPACCDPVKLVFDGKSDHAIPEVTGPTTFNSNGQGYLISYTYNGTSFANVAGATQYIGDGLAVDIGGVAVDVQGNIYVCGDVGDQANNYDTSVVGATTFVTTAGVLTGGRLLQKQDLFVRKYTPVGALTYSVLVGGSNNEFIGGKDYDQTHEGFSYLGDGVTGPPLTLATAYVSGNAIALDTLGDVFITGTCTSFDYPRTRGAFGEVFDEEQNVVVTKISPDASQLIYSTNLKVIGLGEPTGGFSCGSLILPSGIAVDQSGQAYITGNIDPWALRWPTSGTAPFDPTGYSPGSIQTGSLTTDVPVSTTYTTPMPPDLPTSEPWLNVLDPTGTKLVYGTYLGGNLDDKVYGPYVDPFGDVWTFGWTDAFRAFFRSGER